MSRKKFKLFSLFSGAGGMDLGFRLSGKFRNLLANDILPAPAETYAENFCHRIVTTDRIAPDIKLPLYIVGDIADINFDLFKCEEPEVIVGGPPCQDFSIVRGPQKERQGISVKRGRLYSHFIRALIHIQPRIFVFENVPGLKSANNGSAFRTILDDFSKLNIRWHEVRSIIGNSFENEIRNYEIIFHGVINSAWLGVPQRRKRLIIVGVREDLIDRDWLKRRDTLVKEAENILLGHRSLLRKYPVTPLEAFEGLTLPDVKDEYKKIMKEYEGTADIARTYRALEWKEKIWKNLSFDVLKDYFRANNIIPGPMKEIEKAFEEHEKVLKQLGYYKSRVEGKKFADGSNDIPAELESVLERQRIIPPDENCVFVKGTKWEVEGRGMSLIYRRIHPLKPSYTVVAYGGGGTWSYHYKKERGKLTNRERARLQTFPDSFVLKGSISQVRAQLGEAVPPLLGEKIAEVALTVLKTR